MGQLFEDIPQRQVSIGVELYSCFLSIIAFIFSGNDQYKLETKVGPKVQQRIKDLRHYQLK